MNYIVLDLEYNQPEGINMNWLSKYVKNEIIEFGAIKIDDDFNFISGFKCYVKPSIYPKINSRVLNLLGYETQEYIDTNSTSFKNAINLFRNFIGEEEFEFMVWANNDISVLKENCAVYKIDYTWFDKRRIHDIQRVYMYKNKLKNNPSLKSVVQNLKINIEDKSHMAYCDALNTYKIANELGKNCILNFDDTVFINLKKYKLDRILKCPKCGRFSKNSEDNIKISIDKATNQVRIAKFSICNNCNLFIRKLYIFKKHRLIGGKVKISDLRNKDVVRRLKEEIS